MSITNSLFIPEHIVTFILEYADLTTISQIKSASKYINKYFNSRFLETYNRFHTIVYNRPHSPPLSQSSPLLSSLNIKSPLPSYLKPNIHIIYDLLKNFEKPASFFRMISPLTLYQHKLPRYSTLSGMVPFIKIPTAMGFYKLISVYPYTENPELFVIDNLGGMSSKDREFNVKLYYTKTFNAYDHKYTFEELFQKLLPHISV